MQASTSKRGVWLEIAPTRRQQENDTLKTMTGATLQSSGMMSWPTAVFWSKAAVTAIWWPAAQHFFIVQEWGRHQELIFRYIFFYQLSQFILRKLSDVSCQVFWEIGYNDAKWHSLFNGTEQDGNCNVVFQWSIVTRMAVKHHLFFCLLATTGTILMSSSLQHDRQHVL